ADCDCREGTATGQNRAPAKEIAVRLAVEGRTVERHTARAVEKLWPKIRVDVARYAAGQGWLAGKCRSPRLPRHRLVAHRAIVARRADTPRAMWPPPATRSCSRWLSCRASGRPAAFG